MAIPQAYIEEMVARNDIVDVVSQSVQLRRRGRTYVGLCPFHNEKTGSFTVYPESQSFYCFGCGAGGDVITFVKKLNNLDYVEAVKMLAARAGMALPEEDDATGRQRRRILEVNKAAARFFYDQLNSDVGREARAYWRKRGLSDATIRQFGLGYAPDGFHALRDALRAKGFSDNDMVEAAVIKRGERGGTYDIFRNRVMTPILDLRGNVIAFGGRVMDDSKPKYINSPETLVYKKSRTFFALNIAKKAAARRYILSEGYMDVISMHQAGFTTAVAGCGTALTQEQVKLLCQYADEVVLCYDADEAGQKATARAIGLFRETPVKVTVLNIPLERAKDPDEYIKKYGSEAFGLLLDGSNNTVEYGLRKLRQAYDLSQPAGRVEYVRDAVNFLAANATPTEQDVYAGRLAQETDITKSAILTQLEGVSKAKGRQAARKREKQLMEEGSAAAIKLPYNATGSRAMGVAFSEQNLVALILRSPEYASVIRTALRSHEFVDAQFGQIFAVVDELCAEGAPPELPVLAQHLDESALSALSRALAQSHDLLIGEKDVQMYLNRLQDGEPASEKAGTMSPEQLQDYLEKLKQQKT